MNIFYINEDPKIASLEHCDKHAVKMCVEYAQLLSTAHRLLDGKEFVGKSKTGRNVKRWKHPVDFMDKNLQQKARKVLKQKMSFLLKKLSSQVDIQKI